MSELLDKMSRLVTAESSFDDLESEYNEPVVDDRPKKKRVRYDDKVIDKKKSEEPEAAPLDPSLFEDLNEIEFDPPQRTQKRKLSPMEKINKTLADLDDAFKDDLAADLDRYLDFGLEEDEDQDLANQLIGYGRKFARDTAISSEGSEIAKAYSKSERKLKALLEEIDEDKESIDATLKSLGGRYSKNFKTLSELYSAKNSLHSTQLQVVKEMNSMKKVQFELRMKEEAKKSSEEGGGVDSANLFKQIFGAGRGDMIDSIGGYESISGAHEDQYDTGYRPMLSDDLDIAPSDGDKFLEYEDKGAHLVLIVHEDNDRTQYDVIAEDRDGNYLPDYPLPSNIERLEFDINRGTMEASDNLCRTYIVRYQDN